MKKKVYIIGQVGSGKTTLAKNISKRYGISYYELDKVVWDDDNVNVKREVLERYKLFKDLLIVMSGL